MGVDLSKHILEQILGLASSDGRQTQADAERTQVDAEQPREDMPQKERARPQKEQAQLDETPQTARPCQPRGTRHRLRQGIALAVILGAPRSLAPYRRRHRSS